MAFSRQIDYHILISEGASSSYIAYDPRVKYFFGGGMEGYKGYVAGTVEFDVFL